MNYRHTISAENVGFEFLEVNFLKRNTAFTNTTRDSHQNPMFKTLNLFTRQLESNDKIKYQYLLIPDIC